jgi:Rieske Fe-S protein
MHLGEFRVTRQKFIVGGFGLAAAVLAACTTYGKKPEDPGETAGATTEPAPAAGAPGNAIAKTSDVPVGSGVISDKTVLTQPSAGEFKAFSTVCTHKGCDVSEVAGGTINCPCHGSKFNLDGSVANGPAAEPLKAKNISVEGDSIVLR